MNYTCINERVGSAKAPPGTNPLNSDSITASCIKNVKKLVILLGDNDLARAYHALTLAISARAMGYEAKLFATGLGSLIFAKRPRTRLIGLPALARLFIRGALRRLGAYRLEELVEKALGAGVEIYVEEPVLRLLGLEPREGVRIGGAMAFLAEAESADLVLTF